ncbi:MAG: hypothetical protein Q9204_008837 [Flavoplaca sp. TL-2023a]
MGSSHSKPRKPVRKNQISYPRTQAHSHPLHAYGHSHPQPHPQPQPVHQARHSKGSWRHPQEPQCYGTSRVVAYGKAKSVYLPEVQYYELRGPSYYCCEEADPKETVAGASE